MWHTCPCHAILHLLNIRPPYTTIVDSTIKQHSKSLDISRYNVKVLLILSHISSHISIIYINRQWQVALCIVSISSSLSSCTSTSTFFDNNVLLLTSFSVQDFYISTFVLILRPPLQDSITTSLMILYPNRATHVKSLLSYTRWRNGMCVYMWASWCVYLFLCQTVIFFGPNAKNGHLLRHGQFCAGCRPSWLETDRQRGVNVTSWYIYHKQFSVSTTNNLLTLLTVYSVTKCFINENQPKKRSSLI